MFLGGKMEEPGLVHILSHIAHEDIPGASSTTEVFSFRSQLLPFCMNQFRLHFFFNLINWQRSKSIFRVLILSKKAKAPFVPCSPCHVCRRISQWPCSVELGLYCGFLGQLDSQKRSSALITSAFPFLFLSKTNVRICHFCIYVFLGFTISFIGLSFLTPCRALHVWVIPDPSCYWSLHSSRPCTGCSLHMESFSLLSAWQTASVIFLNLSLTVTSLCKTSLCFLTT